MTLEQGWMMMGAHLICHHSSGTAAFPLVSKHCWWNEQYIFPSDFLQGNVPATFCLESAIKLGLVQRSYTLKRDPSQENNLLDQFQDVFTSLRELPWEYDVVVDISRPVHNQVYILCNTQAQKSKWSKMSKTCMKHTSLKQFWVFTSSFSNIIFERSLVIGSMDPTQKKGETFGWYIM